MQLEYALMKCSIFLKVDKCLNLFEAQGLTSMLEGFVTFYSGADCSYEVETPDPSCQ